MLTFILTFLSLQAGQTATSWERVRSPDNSSLVKFPGKPQGQVDKDIARYTFEVKGRQYKVTFYQALSAEDLDWVNMRPGFPPHAGLTRWYMFQNCFTWDSLKSETARPCASQPGEFIHVKAETWSVLAWLVLDKPRMVVMEVWGDAAMSENDPEVKQFFGSLGFRQP